MEAGNDTTLQQDLDDLAANLSEIESLADRTILVTGATGLVGSTIVKALLCINRLKSAGMRVIAMVRNEAKAETIFKEVLDRPDFSVVVAELTRQIAYTGQCDVIIHCASVTSSKEMVTYPVDTIETSILGTLNILNFAVDAGCKSFVYVSSMEVYGIIDGDSREVCENQLGYIDPLAVRSNYPESKRMCENLAVAFNVQHGLNTKIARLSQTFGAGVRYEDTRVFAQFARSVIEDKDIVLRTTGQSEGNYTYLADAVRALLTIATRGEPGQAYNIANPECHTTIAGMAKLVAEEVAQGKIKVTFDIDETNSSGFAPATKLKLNSDKLQSLGWKPIYGLGDSYRRMIQSMEKQQD